MKKSTFSNIKKSKNMENVRMSHERFEKRLDDDFIIVKYPSAKKPWYVCDYYTPSLKVKRIAVFVDE